MPTKPRRENYEPNDEDRSLLLAGLKLGMPVAQIAQRLDVSDRVFRRAYNDIIVESNIVSGRPNFEPSDQQRDVVRLASAVGQPHSEIANLLGIGEAALRQYFREDLDIGQAQANFKVGGNLFKMATGNPDAKNTALMAMWWSKARMGWKDTSRIEQTGADGGPIQTQSQVMVWLPDNGRGDSNVPVTDHEGNVIEPGFEVVTGSDMTAIEDQSNVSEDDSSADEGE